MVYFVRLARHCSAHFLTMRFPAGIVTLIIATLTIVTLSGCAINPATGEANIVMMSEADELRIGREEHEKIINSMPLYQDEALNTYVNAVGQRLAAHSDRPELDYTFTIIDSPDINAFALPGGYIYIFRGLLTYLQSEAQLAAVLSHEIAHITARHTVRQDAAQKGSNIGTGIVSVMSVLTTGTNVGGELANLYSTAAVRGYGRDMELEADDYGAQYLKRSGYDPQAMLEVIGVLKDHERFTRLKAQEKGEKIQTYHGVFASHPRNDQRLRELVAKAGDNQAASQPVDPGLFREKTQGLIFGTNYQAAVAAASEAANKEPKDNRYIHQRLGFTLVFPPDWQVQNQRSAIVAQANDNRAQLSLEIDQLRDNIAPSDYIRRELQVPLLQRSEAFSQHGLIGHTGIIPADDQRPHPTRVAVLYQGTRVYIFMGELIDPAADVDYDSLFLSSIRSFQPTRVVRGNAPDTRTVHYVRANQNTTFAALAHLSPLQEYAEEQLRLINGYYPRGEPKPGEWLKIIK